MNNIPGTPKAAQSKRNLVTITVLTAAALSGMVVSLYAPRLISAQYAWAVTLLVFVSVKIGGDVCKALIIWQPLFIVEDFLKDVFSFVVLSAVAFVASILAQQYIGGQVGPLIPAVGAYVVYSIVFSDH